MSDNSSPFKPLKSQISRTPVPSSSFASGNSDSNIFGSPFKPLGSSNTTSSEESPFKKATVTEPAPAAAEASPFKPLGSAPAASAPASREASPFKPIGSAPAASAPASSEASPFKPIGSSKPASTDASPFKSAPAAASASPFSSRPAASTTNKAPAPFKPIGGPVTKSEAPKTTVPKPPVHRAPGAAATGSRSNTMNRPGSDSLNANATATAAAIAFAKDQETKKEFAPAISTGFIPPVIEEKEEKKEEYSPFKPIPKAKAPIKRSDSINALKAKEEAAEAPQIDEPKPIFAPIKEENKGPAIGRFVPGALDTVPVNPDFEKARERAREKSISSRQTATELKFMPFDESQVQTFGSGMPKPSLQDRVDSANKVPLAFTPIADPNAYEKHGALGHKPTINERVEQQNTQPFAFTPTPSDNTVSAAEEEVVSPFKPLKEKPAFTKPTFNRPAASEAPANQSPFAPRRTND